MNAQQNICVEDQKKLSESIDSILGNAPDDTDNVTAGIPML